MFRLFLFATAAIGLVLANTSAASADAATDTQVGDQSGPAQTGPSAIETVTVTAKKLDDARNGIQTQTGASTYTITAADIEAAPGGENNLLNQVALQAPSVAQDSFGQFHVRGEHNALQYRLNGVILPEGISVFGQTLDPRLASSVRLITGALPAEYGLVTGGIMDIQTKSGFFQPGGEVGIYGGSHGTIEPSIDYGGSDGNLNYFVAGDYLSDGVGIESPNGSANPIHDDTAQYHGFAYLQDILDEHSQITAILGISHDHFQIPDNPGQVPSYDVFGELTVPSSKLNEAQREITDYAILSYLRSQGEFDFQVSGFARLSSLNFTPDAIGDIQYNGIAQDAYKKDTSGGIQAEGAWHRNDAHTVRGGILVQTERATSDTTSQVLPANCTGNGSLSDPFDCTPVVAPFNKPITIVDNGAKTQNTYSAYLQDEWKIFSNLTLNYGLRYDDYKAYSSGNQLSPRANLVWQATQSTTLHAGYARYFSPPPFENVGTEDALKFVNTTASPAVLLDNVTKAERSNYFDAGVEQQLMENFTVGWDNYYKLSRNLIDEGQFGAPIILTPFNYAKGKQYGTELTANYSDAHFQAYGNLALEHAQGEDITSSQFDFDPGDLAYIADHYIHLDHEQYLTASGGASYLWGTTRFSVDLLYGSGLRKDNDVLDIPNGLHVPGYTQVNFGISHDFDLGANGDLTARADIINLFDDKYEIRDGTGVGVGAPQWGPRRGFFVGLSKSI